LELTLDEEGGGDGCFGAQGDGVRVLKEVDKELGVVDKGKGRADPCVNRGQIAREGEVARRIGDAAGDETSGTIRIHDALVDVGIGGGPKELDGDGILDGGVGGHEGNRKLGTGGVGEVYGHVGEDAVGEDVEAGGGGFGTSEVLAFPLERTNQTSSRIRARGWTWDGRGGVGENSCFSRENRIVRARKRQRDRRVRRSGGNGFIGREEIELGQKSRKQRNQSGFHRERRRRGGY